MTPCRLHLLRVNIRKLLHVCEHELCDRNMLINYRKYTAYASVSGVTLRLPLFPHCLVFMKLFRTSSIEIKNKCQEYFNFEMLSELWQKRVNRFENKF